MSEAELQSCPLGLYKVWWKSGGSSLAAIGMMSDGKRWIAPTNWVSPGKATTKGWGGIKRIKPVGPKP